MTQPLYFHGIPGAAAEVALAGHAPTDFGTLSTHNGHLIAFSLGAHRALTYAAAYPDRVTQITLISPAAPIRTPADLHGVAGAPVFKAARSPLGLRGLHLGQSLFLRAAPNRFLAMLFQDTCSADQSFAAGHQSQLISVLRDSLLYHGPAYRAALTAYVQDWSALLPQITAPVTLHHGTADTWAPIRMADQLMKALPNAVLHRHEGLGHYSTYKAVLTKCLLAAQAPA
ncbi:alpha/beta fold hydrolase [Nereida sp. MMG025]|uniref:alpha/beta fold hydrolase n=1 Tax=Nereida sp. MMG025 TaxID=2909981 RepID=UPI001F40C041|nr:alpha/beta hydrolase [Nereida sp. MMG025]MCF6443513.1 alpha/beta hydrolase [Nereida sp. MMG025]